MYFYFNFYSVFIILVSFLPTIRREMSITLFYFVIIIIIIILFVLIFVLLLLF